MLSVTIDGVGARVRGPRRRAIAAALWPTARVAGMGPAMLTVVLGVAPGVFAVVRGDAIGDTAMIMASLAAGAAVGWAVEDPVGEMFAALPIPPSGRLLMRISSVAVLVTALMVLFLGAAAIAGDLPADLADRAPEAAASASFALASGLYAGRRGGRAVAAAAVTAGVLGVAVIGGLAMRWPALLPALRSSPVHGRWWLLALAALAIAVWSGRDTGRPGLRWRPRTVLKRLFE